MTHESDPPQREPPRGFPGRELLSGLLIALALVALVLLARPRTETAAVTPPSTATGVPGRSVGAIDTPTPPAALAAHATDRALVPVRAPTRAQPTVTPTPATVAVHVAGEVRRPGLYTLARGSRIGDAVRLAGGMTAEADPVAVNLAQRLSDEMQIVVPGRAIQPPPPGESAAAADRDGKPDPTARPLVSTPPPTPTTTPDVSTPPGAAKRDTPNRDTAREAPATPDDAGREGADVGTGAAPRATTAPDASTEDAETDVTDEDVASAEKPGATPARDDAEQPAATSVPSGERAPGTDAATDAAPEPTATPVPRGEDGAVVAAPDTPVNINTAVQEQLESLPGIGPSKARAIIEHRERHGAFDRAEDLQDVSGIGPKTWEALKDKVTV